MFLFRLAPSHLLLINIVLILVAIPLAMIAFSEPVPGSLLDKLQRPRPPQSAYDLQPVLAQETPMAQELKPGEPTPAPTPTSIPVGLPERIAIPDLSVEAQVIQIGISENNTMEVPDDASTVGWYEHGVRPGQLGGAILTAHYDTPTGRPAIFYNLEKLQIGQRIEVYSKEHEKFAFKVTELITESYKTFPKELIYNRYDKRELVLITCDGVWDPVGQTYSNRLVVIAELWDDQTS